MTFVCRERHERFHRRRKKGPATLNKNYRKADMMRITEENRKLLMRIANVEPTFRREQWKKRERKHARLLRQMRENSCNGARRATSPRFSESLSYPTPPTSKMQGRRRRRRRQRPQSARRAVDVVSPRAAEYSAAPRSRMANRSARPSTAR